MPAQEDFSVEQFMDKYEEHVEYNVGETCCYSLSFEELKDLTGEKFEFDNNKRLTYGSIRGSPQLRSLIAEIHSNERVQLTQDNVLITNGAIGANFLVHYAVAGPGDHVICVAPTYQQLSSVPKMFGAEVDLLRLKAKDGFLPNLGELKNMVKSNTKLIVINNPNNPLGSVIPMELLQQIAAFAEENGIRVLSDEVYSPLFHSCEQPKSMCQISASGVTTGSMSKAYSAAGVRLGWIVSQDLRFLETAASRRDYNTISVSMIDDAVACYILKNRKAVLDRNLALCTENLGILSDFIKNSEGRFSFVHEPQGGSVCLLQVNGVKDTERFTGVLATQYKVLCAPGECFDVPGTIRIGYGNSKPELVKALELLTKAYDEFLK
ncbi:LADA_0F00408g1_1 [Lachancea dasiensis]|uniref:LADA_0F00408g1_1 n=1 Tax=Lachancea dasiensis TaxID=1072105 RepID=A0A1G4JHX9_9SACH|nr:LADA_0F00408g1_1 [Lachancea dasiensis]